MLAPFIPVESFFNPVLAAEVWPKSIVNNEVLMRQVRQRKKLIECLETRQMAELYESLSDLLDDRDYRRLILYLPFEFLPKAPERFRRAYMKAWRSLLSAHDVRANFVDGDVLEEEQRADDLPRVIKAAHLIPKLVENGLMAVEDAITLMENTADQTLKDSIADSLPVLADMGFFPEKEIKTREKLIKRETKVITEKRKAWLASRGKQKTIINVDERQLAGPFSENLKLMKQEMDDVREMVASVQSDPKLSRLIYPVVLVFGSRLNGYGEHDSDIDIAIFVRPGTSFGNRLELQELLKETFAHEKIKTNEIIEFWLEEKESKLLVRDFTEWDVSLGVSYWTHVLFGAAWEGNDDAMRELHKKLLVPYMHNTDARSLYLEDMEQSTLQYRLMHKGYERFFPPCGGIHTKHADEIDGKSMFWDSGYRQLATKLFIGRVFLPKI